MEKKEVTVEEKVQLPKLLEEFRTALEKEIRTIKKHGQSSILIYGGKKVPTTTSDFWYVFKIEYMPDLPADTPCKLTVESSYYDVTVIQVTDNEITLSSSVELPDNLGKARLDNGSTVLMERLIKRIEDNAKSANPAASRILETNDLSINSNFSKIHAYELDSIVRDSNNNNEQNAALLSAINNDITYIWGPPGTGKTTVIKDIILNLLIQNRSVLLVSHTNTAVDGAIKKVDREYFDKNGIKENEQYPILRVGNISGQDNSSRIQIESHIKQAGRELQEKRDELIVERKKFETELKEISQCIFKFEWVDSNKIEEGMAVVSRINENIKKVKKLEELKAHTAELITQQKNAHPECLDYLSFAKQLKQAKAEKDALEVSYGYYTEELSKADSQINEALAAIICWDKFLRLEKELNKFLPIDLQRSKLKKLSSELGHSEALLNEIETSLRTEKENLEKYNQRRGVLSKAIVKKNIEKTKERINELESSAALLKQDAAGNKSAYSALNDELMKTLSIESQMKLLDVKRSRYEWEKILEDSNVRKAAMQHRISIVEPKLLKLREDLTAIETKAEMKKTAFQKIASLSSELRSINNNIKKLKKESLKDVLSDIVENEKRNLFTATGKLISAISNAESLKILEQEINLVRGEIIDLHLDELKAEYTELKEAINNRSRQITEIERQLDELKKAVILNAKVLGTTLAKSYLDDTIQSRKFDTVILDEASMASIPALWCACLLAENNIIIVGDFMQLPPIVIADGKSKDDELARKWLGRDAFEASGMQTRLKDNDKGEPDNFISLTSQYRMEEEIAEVANIYYGEYNKSLKSPGNDMPFRCKERSEFQKWYSMAEDKATLHLVDTSNLNAWATGVPRGKKHSRLNYFSASLCVEMAFRFLGKKLDEKPVNIAPNILIIAPYKPHVSRIQELIELKYKVLGLPENSNFIEVGTVHSFQGKEADIVIFDLVVDEPHWRANIFMPDENVNDGLKKLYNVAVTRAKFKLFIVGNMKFFRKRAKENALSNLLDVLERNNAQWIDAKEAYPMLSFSMNLNKGYSLDDVKEYMSCNESQFYNYICTDIKHCKSQLIIYSPFMTESRISTLLPLLVDAVNTGVKLVVVTKTLGERKSQEVSAYKKCEQILTSNGAHIIHKKGMHEKNIFIDGIIMWCGSLNMLSFTGNTGEYMLRIKSNKITQDSMKELGCNELIVPIEKTAEKYCPICNEELIAAEGGEGGFYWKCSKCDYSRNREEQYPYDGLLKCPKCGSSLKFDMINEPRWVCEENSKHYKKLKLNDIRLEKMKALISAADMKRLKRYYTSSKDEKMKKAWYKYEKQKTALEEADKVEPEQMTLFDQWP